VIGSRVTIDGARNWHYTTTRFVVLDRAKGSLWPGDEFELRLLGGQAPGSGYATVVADMPQFDDGEEVVLFTRVVDERQILVGVQGVMRTVVGPDGPILRDPVFEGTPRLDGGPALVPAPVRRAGTRPGAAVGARTSQPPQPGTGKASAESPGPAVPRARTVDGFLQRVRRIVGERSSGETR